MAPSGNKSPGHEMNGEDLTELEQEVVRRYVKGQPTEQVAAGLGLNAYWVYNILVFAGVTRKRPGRMPNIRRDREIARLYAEDGMSQTEVARRFGLSDAAVRKILTLAGVIRRRPGAPCNKTRRNREIVRLYVREGLTLREVGARFGLSRERIRQILERAGRSRRKPSDSRRSRPRRKQLTERDDQIANLYAAERLTLREVAARFGLNARTVSQSLKRSGVSRRSGSSRLPNAELRERNQEIIRLYVEEGLSPKQVGALVGVSEVHVGRLLRMAAVTRRKPSDSRRSGPRRKQLTQRNQEIARLYADEGLTAEKVGARFGLSKQRVCQILEGAGVNRRRWWLG